MILTVSRIEAEKKANPGYRAFFANGFNVTRALVLFFWEVVARVDGRARASERRDVRPRGHRGGIYPLCAAAMCVIVRDLIVYGVLTDMMRGRPAVYATFSSYDEVAHHSGLERADTLEALRKLDQQFARIDRARRYAPRPYELVVLSDHGQTQGATFKQRNGYGLDDLVERSLEATDVKEFAGGDEQTADGRPRHGRGDRQAATKPHEERRLAAGTSVVLGSGNLGLIYLMEEQRRLTMEEIDERHPRLIPALREHPHVGWILVRSSEHGAVALGANGTHYLADGRIEGEDPLAPFSPTAPQHLLRTDGFAHVADIMVGSFYDPALEEGCAFEELISFHGGLGGPQTRPFILAPGRSAAAGRGHHRRGRRARSAAQVAPQAAGRGRVVGAGRGWLTTPARISVLDQSPIAEGVDRRAGAQEHDRPRAAHGRPRLRAATGSPSTTATPMLASAAPEILIAEIAAATERIRVGSGGVMLPHYSPLKVAETFSILGGPARRTASISASAARPASDPRDDVRAAARPPAAVARRLPRAARRAARLPRGRLPGRPPVRAARGAARRARQSPTSGCSAPRRRARSGRRELGLPYSIADFINPDGARERPPLPRALPALASAGHEPELAVCVSAICADTRRGGAAARVQPAHGDHAAAPRPADRRATGRDGARVPAEDGRRPPRPAGAWSSARRTSSAPGSRRRAPSTAPTS